MINQYHVIGLGLAIAAFFFLASWLEDRTFSPRRRSHSHRR